MIKIGKDTKDVRLGDKQVLKVYKGDRVVWQKEDELIFHKENAYSVELNISNATRLNPNQAYKFVTSVENSRYDLVVFKSKNDYEGKEYDLKNNDVFSVSGNCKIEINNVQARFFDLFIYKTADKPKLKIKI